MFPAPRTFKTGGLNEAAWENILDQKAMREPKTEKALFVTFPARPGLKCGILGS
jgi:hypothetical protein